MNFIGNIGISRGRRGLLFYSFIDFTFLGLVSILSSYGATILTPSFSFLEAKLMPVLVIFSRKFSCSSTLLFKGSPSYP